MKKLNYTFLFSLVLGIIFCNASQLASDVPDNKLNPLAVDISNLEMGITAGGKGELLDARAYFQAHLEDNPNSGRALRGIAHTYLFVEKDVPTAIKYYRKGWENEDLESLGNLAFLYFTNREMYKEDLNNIQNDLRKNSQKNHLVALATVILAEKNNDPLLFRHGFNSIKIQEIEKPENITAIIFLLEKFGHTAEIAPFIAEVQKVHGNKFDKVIAEAVNEK